MNFNFIATLLFASFFLCACGVKGNPLSPKDQNLPSVIDNYTDIKVDQSLDDSINRKK